MVETKIAFDKLLDLISLTEFVSSKDRSEKLLSNFPYFWTKLVEEKIYLTRMLQRD